MNEKEIAEIRRRFRGDKSNINHIRGCYVNEKREIISQFDQALSMMPQEETEEICWGFSSGPFREPWERI